MKLCRCFALLPTLLSIMALSRFAAGPNAAAATAGDLDTLDAQVASAAAGYVVGTAVQPDGKILIVGTFDSVGGVTRHNVARLNSDGTLDASFDPNANAPVFNVTVQPDGKVLLGGYFTLLQPNGASSPVARNYVARVNADGTLDASFDPNPDSFVYGTSVRPDGRVLVWGNFSTVAPNGGALVNRRGIARFSAAGVLDTGFDPNPNGYVFAAAAQEDGKVLLGGYFTQLQPNAAGAPVARRSCARVNDDGSLDMGFDPSPDLRVFSLRVQADGKVLLSGDFAAVQPNGDPAPTPRQFIARVNGDGSVDPAFHPDANSEVNTIEVQADGKVLFAGAFTAVQVITPHNRVARFNGAGTFDAAFDPNPDSGVFGVALQGDGKVLLNGVFNSLQPNGAVAPSPRAFFARVLNDAATGSVTAPDATQVLWQRGGAAPEISGAIFERSLDDGATWTALGLGVRDGTSADWRLTGLSLGGLRGKLRARGFTAGGYFNASGGLIEQVGDFDTTAGFTLIPSLTAPAASSATKSPVSVGFTLPEAALGGSVKLTFDRVGGGLTRTLTLAAAQESAGAHSFTFDPANPTLSSAVAAIAPVGTNIPDGSYDVTLSYQDAAANPAASVTNAGVKIDTLTQSPALLSLPQSASTFGGPVVSSNASSSLLINLPEAALPGSVVFTFDDGTTQRVLTTTAAVTASGNNQIIFGPSDPVGTGRLVFNGSVVNLVAFASGSAIPDGGPYSVSFTYQDAVGNAAVTSNVATGVTVDTATQPPTLTQPAANAVVGNPVTVSLTLPEAALDSPGAITLSFGSTALLLDQSLRTAGTHSFTFDPADPPGTSGGAITSGGPVADGDYTVTLSYRDAVFNAAATAAHAHVKVDTTAPAIGGPSGGFSPLIVFAGTLPNYIPQAIASPDTVLVTQQPAAGSATTPGPVHVVLTATDAAGNQGTTPIDVLVRPLAATSAVTLSPGEAAIDAGLPDGPPADATFTSFGVPAIDDAATLAFTAKWTSPSLGKGSGLFTSLACLALVGGDVPGLVDTKFRTFNDPVIHDGKLACIATITGAMKGSVVLYGPVTGPLAVLAQTGTIAPDVDDAKFKSFGGVAVMNDSVGFMAQLAARTGLPAATSANDTGLWLKDPIQPLGLVLREGPQTGGLGIKTLAAFKAGSGSPGAGRGWVRQPNEGRMLALVTNSDKTQAVLEAGPFGVASLTQKLPDVPGAPGATFASFGLPTANALDHVAFLAKLAVGGTVTKANASAIFADFGGAEFTTIARAGSDAGGTGAKFSLLKDPVLADDGGLAFAATIKGGTVKGLAASTLWWQAPNGSLALLAQGGARPGPDLPAEAQWKSFTSLAIAAGRGPVFAATLVPGKGTVTAKNASGVWACDFNGEPRVLFRTDDTFQTLNGPKKLKSFTLLKAAVGSVGAARSYNAARQVVWLATFTDKTQAVITSEVP